MPSFLWYVPSLTSGMFLNLILFSWVLDAVGVNVLESCGKLFRAFKLQPSSGGFVETLSAQVDKIVWVFLRTSLAKFWRLYYLEGVQNSFSPNAWTLFALVRTRLSCYPLKTFTLFLSGRHEKPHLFFIFISPPSSPFPHRTAVWPRAAESTNQKAVCFASTHEPGLAHFHWCASRIHT